MLCPFLIFCNVFFLHLFFVGICSCNHIINVRTDTLIKAKDRVYIAGVLASKTKFLDDRQIIQSFTIKVKRFQLRDGTEVESDINRTKLIGPICSKIKHTDKYSIFTMKFTHTARLVNFEANILKLV